MGSAPWVVSDELWSRVEPLPRDCLLVARTSRELSDEVYGLLEQDSMR
jgi:hypothetical protein